MYLKKYILDICAKFGACITKWKIPMEYWLNLPHYHASLAFNSVRLFTVHFDVQNILIFRYVILLSLKASFPGLKHYKTFAKYFTCIHAQSVCLCQHDTDTRFTYTHLYIHICVLTRTLLYIHLCFQMMNVKCVQQLVVLCTNCSLRPQPC